MFFPLALLTLFALVTCGSLFYILRRHGHPVLAVWVTLLALALFVGIYLFLTLWFFPQLEGL